jgi:integrase
MSLTVKETITYYLKDIEGRVARDEFDSTNAFNTERELSRFAARFGEQDVDQCRQHDLTAWLNENPQWKAVESRRRIISIITGCFRWAEDEELIDRCPYRRPRSLRGLPAKVRRPATSAEIVQLMRGGSKPLRRALYILIKTGMRTCEMRKLVWDDVLLDVPTPHLSIARHKTFRKTGKPRLIGLDASTVRFLRNLKRQYEGYCRFAETFGADWPPPFVFTNCDGTPWDKNAFARHLRRYAERFGLDEGVDERVSV